MIASAYKYRSTERRDPGFLRRMWAMVIKEFVQMRRDRMTFATMIFVPIMQLVLFGYAINTDPRALPAAVVNFILTEKYRQDPGLAASIVVISTMISIVTIPLALWLIL